MTQYVRCGFGSTPKPPGYTYANNGVRLEGGERVLVERAGKCVPVTVLEVDVEAPPLPDGKQYKAILGLAPVEPAPV